MTGVDRAASLVEAGRVARAAARFLAAYGPVALLVGTLFGAILVPTIGKVRPRPGVPPDGYLTENLSVRLSWERGDAQGDLLLEVADEPGFRRPLLQKRTRSSALSVPGLLRGQTYYWRLEQDGGAIVAFFRTSPHAVRF